MKKLLTLTVLVMLLGMAGSASAVIGWAGAIWPNSGAALTPTGPVDVYIQVWIDGVSPAEDVNTVVEMTLSNDIGGSVVVPMGYLGANFSNAEYTGQIPQSLLMGAATVTAAFAVSDLDGAFMDPINDQAGNASPLTYNVVDVLPNDVDVTFELCMSGEVHDGAPYVVGSDPVIGEWCNNGLPVQMNSMGGDLYEVTIAFPAGSNPSFEYKYQKIECDQWEGVDNRLVTLPTDGTAAVTLDTDSWNNLPMGCGMGSDLEEDKAVCFQVCLEGVENMGGVCIAGNLPELGNWTGVPMTMVGPDLYQLCVIFPAGIAIPLNVEYKFLKDDCGSWESVGNRVFTVDNSIDASTTVTHTFDDGPGQCEVVATEDTNWGTLKTMYR